MNDRLVRKISPTPEPSERPKPFSEYLGRRNLVLLGDPGAGKTHLFNHFATMEGGYQLRARDFLNLDVDSLSANKILFIDALDEKRAGRGDQNTIDKMVEKLCMVKPDQVRIACRAADWLGETDLSAFQAYFDRCGGCVVLSLEPLSEEESLAVLRVRGISEPEAFLDEARRRGLDELLSNPQNLIMLSDVVQKRAWPTSRKELFKETVDLLLSEHNATHTRRETGSYSSSELLEAAGGLCAVRLISDIDGISLSETSPNNDFPSYRCINLCDRNKTQAVLGRRAFVAGSISETVDYTHRTIAEYLAASWLAARIRAGLPIGRVRAVIGVDGRPASELRGLNAWLAVFLTEHAATLIDADPFGVLSYGDVSSLTTGLRRHLFNALAKLAEVDPWFRAGNWSSPALAALSGSDMVESFRAILNNKDAGFHLRSLVLDSIAAGTPIPALQTDLIEVLTDTTAPYAERCASVEGLLAVGPTGVDSIVTVYPGLGSSDDDLRLRADILKKLYGTRLGIFEVTALLNEALETKSKLTGGAFRGLDDAIRDGDIGDILDRLEIVGWHSDMRHPYRSVAEVLRIVDKLLVRFLSLHPDVDGEWLLKWLDFRYRCREYYDRRAKEKLQAVLSGNQGVLTRLTDTAIRSLGVGDLNWGFVYDLQRLTLGSLDDRLLVDRISAALGYEKAEKRAFLYELAIKLTFRIDAEARSIFESLYHYADGNQALETVRDNCCVSNIEIENWRTQEIRDQKEHLAERESDRVKNRIDFETSTEQIRSGNHLGWLEWIGRVYFARFSDVDDQVSPQERLISELGEKNTRIALEGLVALVRKGAITDLEDVVRMAAESKCYDWWYAVIAGLDEYYDAGHSLDALSDNYFRSVLAIDCLHPTYRREGNVRHQIEHGWKTELLSRYPQCAVDAYLALARSGIERHALSIHGLSELMDLEPLDPYGMDVAMALLDEYPTASSESLQQLLPIALHGNDREKLLALIRSRLAKCLLDNKEDSYALWLACGFLVAPTEFRREIDNLEGDVVQKTIWTLRDFSGLGRSAKPDFTDFSVDQLEYIARLTASHFTKSGFPLDTLQGDRNPWDATEFVCQMINLLSADPSMLATEALARLATDASMESYRDDAKHALAQQKVRRIDAEFWQPTWKESVEVLKNGTPASVADLHALMVVHLTDLGPTIAASNTDIYKRFWNERGHGQITTPKSEDSCRDVLVDLLRSRLGPQNVVVEPEGHMANDKRADIVATRPGMKVVVELKRDYHKKVWLAIQNQLDRFYTRDPEAQEFGIYVVFWYGANRGKSIPTPTAPLTKPQSAAEMQIQLQSLIPAEKSTKLRAIVIDVSGDVS